MPRCSHSWWCFETPWEELVVLHKLQSSNMEQKKVVSAGIRRALGCWQAPGREFWQHYFLGLEICCLVHSDALKDACGCCPFCTFFAKTVMCLESSPTCQDML